jgi:hypothetical protein
VVPGAKRGQPQNYLKLLLFRYMQRRGGDPGGEADEDPFKSAEQCNGLQQEITSGPFVTCVLSRAGFRGQPRE